jgi:hypothetical protein
MLPFRFVCLVLAGAAALGWISPAAAQAPAADPRCAGKLGTERVLAVDPDGLLVGT